MSRRHYIPVAAKRRALETYRDRRKGGEPPWNVRPLDPTEAMQSTARYFAGHLAAEVAFDHSPERRQELLDGFRAAVYYQARLYKMPWRQWPVNNPAAWADSYTQRFDDADQREPERAEVGAVSAAGNDVWFGEQLARSYGAGKGRRIAEAMLADVERLAGTGDTTD
jgi:hypothetical protein